MDLIIGGAHQGKLEYALRTYGLTTQDVCDFSGEDYDTSKRVLYHFEVYIMKCMREGTDPAEMVGPDSLIIADDIFCGVVPVDQEVRAWREQCGRVMTALALRAQSVVRIFCGLPMKLK